MLEPHTLEAGTDPGAGQCVGGQCKMRILAIACGRCSSVFRHIIHRHLPADELALQGPAGPPEETIDKNHMRHRQRRKADKHHP